MEQQEKSTVKAQILTPFESAQERVAEFAENFVQAQMWATMGNKLAALSGKDDPASLQSRFAIENFISEAIKTIPSLNTGEA